MNTKPYNGYGPAVAWVLGPVFKALKPRAKVLLYALSARTNGKSGRSFMTVQTLVFDSGLSRKHVLIAIRELAKAGILAFSRDKNVTSEFVFWLALTGPKEFSVSVSGDKFGEYRQVMDGHYKAPIRPSQKGPTSPWARTKKSPPQGPTVRDESSLVRVRQGPTVLDSRTVGPRAFSQVKQEISAQSANFDGGNTEGTQKNGLVRHTDAPSRENEGLNGGTAPGEKKDSSMLDGQGAVDGGARRAPPAPPTGRRADAAPSVSLDDFAETKKKRKGRPLSEGTPGQRLLDAFCVAYRERFGIAYTPSWGRDLKLAKEMATSYPPDLLPAMLKAFFSDKDPFLTREGFPFSLFRHRVNTYAFQARRATKGRSGYKAEETPIGKRVFVEETEHAVTHRVFTANGWEFEVVKKEKPKAEPRIMPEGEEFE